MDCLNVLLELFKDLSDWRRGWSRLWKVEVFLFLIWDIVGGGYLPDLRIRLVVIESFNYFIISDLLRVF